MVQKSALLTLTLILLVEWSPFSTASDHCSSDMSSCRLLSVNFEVFGRVQGVFFRKYTKIEAQKLGLVGWVRNTASDTVEGQIQGAEGKVTEMKKWLTTVGSPHSRIDSCRFTNEVEIEKLGYKSFAVVH